MADSVSNEVLDYLSRSLAGTHINPTTVMNTHAIPPPLYYAMSPISSTPIPHPTILQPQNTSYHFSPQSGFPNDSMPPYSYAPHYPNTYPGSSSYGQVYTESPSEHHQQYHTPTPISEYAKKLEQIAELEERVAEIGSNDLAMALDSIKCCLLPPKFKMLGTVRFDGTTCPKTHIGSFILTMKAMNVPKEVMTVVFPQSLKGTPLCWFMHLEAYEKISWSQVSKLFLAKYQANIGWETTRSDLKCTFQKDDESISEFYKRWTWKLLEIMTPLTNDDQKEIFRSCVKPHLNKALGFGYYPNVREMVDSCIRYENEVHFYAQCSCILQFDGASKGNPGPAGAGAVLREVDGNLVYRVREGLGVVTNNVAEYRGLILGLRFALDRGFQHIRVQGDSKLVCMQVQGIWKAKTANIADLCEVAKNLKDQFQSFHISHVDRELNWEADAQANLAVDLESGEVKVDYE